MKVLGVNGLKIWITGNNPYSFVWIPGIFLKYGKEPVIRRYDFVSLRVYSSEERDQIVAVLEELSVKDFEICGDSDITERHYISGMENGFPENKYWVETKIDNPEILIRILDKLRFLGYKTMWEINRKTYVVV